MLRNINEHKQILAICRIEKLMLFKISIISTRDMNCILVINRDHIIHPRIEFCENVVDYKKIFKKKFYKIYFYYTKI